MSINPFFPPKPIPDTPENLARCQCSKCPSCPGEPFLYCSKGEGTKNVSKKGCICSQCAVYDEFRLNVYFEEGYFCATGKVA